MEPDLKTVAEYLKGLRRRAAVTCRTLPDRVHLGHGILQAAKESPSLTQTDAAVGQSECFSSILHRAVKLARTLFHYGYQPGDSAILVTTTNLDACLPFYACLLNGYPLLTISYDCDVHNLNYYISLVRPKIIFCQAEKESLFRTAIIECDSFANIIIISNAEELRECYNDFEYYPVEFDLCTPAFLVMTSGVTSQPRLVTVSHEMVWNVLPYNYFYFKKFPKPTESVFLISSMQGAIGVQTLLFSSLFGCNRIQSSLPLTKEHFREIIEKYKPTYLMCNTKIFLDLFNTYNLTSLEYIHLTGPHLPEHINESLKIDCPMTMVIQTYSATETFSPILKPNSSLPGITGKQFKCRFEYCLVNKKGFEVTETEKIGELWIKDDYQFLGYYHQSKETVKVVNADSYFKTGDLFYKDIHNNYYFVDRIKKKEF